MFLLTNEYTDDSSDVKGVFDTAEKAKEYVEKVMQRPDVKWSDPSHSIKGTIWANSYGGSLFIQPVAVNPTT